MVQALTHALRPNSRPASYMRARPPQVDWPMMTRESSSDLFYPNPKILSHCKPLATFHNNLYSSLPTNIFCGVAAHPSRRLGNN
jgi:hypothetical protein